MDSRHWANLVLRFFSNGYLSVDLFLILSAFVMGLSYGSVFRIINFHNYAEYLIKHFSRIYLVFVIITLIVFFLFYDLKHYTFLHNLVPNLLLIEVLFDSSHDIVSPRWSLSAEWLLYLLMPFFLWMQHRSRPVFFLLFGTVAVMGLQYLILHSDNYFIGTGWEPVNLNPKNYWDISSGLSAFLRCLSAYWIGLIIYQLYLLRGGAHAEKQMGIYCLLCGGAILYGYHSDCDLVVVWLYGLLILTLAVPSFPARLLSWKPVYFLGKISFSLYLIHEPMIRFVDIYSQKMGFYLDRDILAWTSVLISVLCAVPSYYFIETALSNKVKRYLLRKWIH